MVYVRWGMVFLLLLRAVHTDRREGRIENQLVGAGLLLGIGCAGIETGITGIAEGIKMAALTIAALFVFFVIKGLGAGDIKLFAVLAVFFPGDIISIVAAAFFVGAGICVARMIWRGIRKSPIYKKGETLNFSVPIALGTGIVEIYQFLS